MPEANQAPICAKECPFCGLLGETAHETQEACIEALHSEIARLRDILDQTRSTAWPPVPADEEA
jgi:coproporphyrinogen III oxidase-like Fe-S oxidoreductase